MSEEDIISYLATKGIIAKRLGEKVYIAARKKVYDVDIELFTGFEEFEEWFLSCCADNDNFRIDNSYSYYDIINWVRKDEGEGDVVVMQ